MARLNDKQRQFITAYFICGLNGTEAAKRAGYMAKSDNTFASIASENLRKPHIRAEIDRRLAEHAMSANEVLYRLTEQAQASIADFFTINESTGKPELDMSVAIESGAINNLKSIKVTYAAYGTNIDIQLHDAQSALVQLGRYHKLFTDKVQITDWRDDAIQAIRAGDIEFAPLVKEIGEPLANELFIKAGVTARLADASQARNSKATD